MAHNTELVGGMVCGLQSGGNMSESIQVKPRYICKPQAESFSRRISNVDSSLFKFLPRCTLLLPILGFRHYCDRL